ncbi:MAG TPA: glycosyltransferase family 1 protein [Anaerolineae bacterium]
MRIGFDGTPLIGQRAGVGNYTAHLLAALLERNSADEYLLYSNRPLGRLEPALSKATQVEGYLPPSRWLWMQLVLPRIILQTRPELCHFTNALAPLQQPTPFVLTIHDASLFLYRQYHPRSRLLAIRLLLPVIAHRADAIITVSEYARNDLIQSLQLPREKVHVVYEAPAVEFKPVTDKQRLAALRRKYNLPEKYVLAVGALEPRKNLSRLVRALSKLHERGNEAKLVLAGPSGWMMEGFEKQIDELGLKDDVYYLGYVPAEELPGLYTMATLFAFPSLYEGFGLPPLEAMACGTPVLTSRYSAMAEVCADAAHLVNPRDEGELADALWQLLCDGEWRQELSQRGMQRARQFSWQRAAEQTVAVYRHVLRR